MPFRENLDMLSDKLHTIWIKSLLFWKEKAFKNYTFDTFETNDLKWNPKDQNTSSPY